MGFRDRRAIALGEPPVGIAGGIRGYGELRMFGLGVTELVIILGMVVLIFGARRLPEIGSGVGKAIKNFKSGISSQGEIDVTPEKNQASGDAANDEPDRADRTP